MSPSTRPARASVPDTTAGTSRAPRHAAGDPTTTLLLVFVLVSFAANSLITRHVVAEDLLDAGLLSAVRFVSGAVTLVGLTLVLRERVVVGRANLLPAFWLGVYAVCISYGYRHIGAAPGTFVFYATVLLTLVGWDVLHGDPIPPRRAVGAVISLAGIGVLAGGSMSTVTVTGVGAARADRRGAGASTPPPGARERIRGWRRPATSWCSPRSCCSRRRRAC